MLMPGRGFSAGTGYRYGFNGKENDNDVKGEGNQQDYGMRIYDPRLGRFLTIDPLTEAYPFYTPYQFAGNTPIQAIDLDGLEPWKVKDGPAEGTVYGPYKDQAAAQASVNTSGNTIYLDEVKVVSTKKSSSVNSDNLVPGKITNEVLQNTSRELNVEVAMMKAISKQESRANPFDKQGRPIILFERHKMWQHLKEDGFDLQKRLELQSQYPSIVNQESGGYSDMSSWKKMAIAAGIDENAAIKSASWGKFQVLGETYSWRYKSPQQLKRAMSYSEMEQFMYFKSFLIHKKGMLDAMRNKNWEEIARLYNGNKWKKINPKYASNLETYYLQFKSN
jgi:RHS repeat-associated protein